MKNVLTWVKSNVVTVLSVIVMLASVGVIFWSLSYGGKASEAASKELKQMASRLQSFQNVSVPFPPAEVDAPPEDISGVTINQATLDHLDMVYGGMNAAYRDVFQPMLERNKAGHDLLVPGVLPKTDAGHLRHEARTAYRQAFVDMMEPFNAERDDPNAPRLNAIGPLNPAELQFELQRVEEGYRPTGFGAAARGGGLSETDRKQLEQQKAERAKEMLVERARQAHIYADPYIGSPGFPFTVGQWSLATGLPSYTNIWNSHYDLWVQQDIVRAIGKANKVTNPELSVIESPVKRLISIDVIPGNVGSESMGGMGVAGTVKNSPGAGGGMGYGMGGYGGGMGGYGGMGMGMGGMGGGEGGGENAGEAAAAGGSPDAPLSVDFHTGPSGRVSNSIYDVRHARVVMIVDYQKLPEIFDAFSSVNFMTVLDCQIKDVDEYQALLEGYVYGQNDAVQVDMLIESIWLREWTTKWMPAEIKQKLGIADVAADMAAEEPAM